ncbi:MAG: hypothetical protein RLY71_3426 [Pseudomonadota bacterium]|jgi:hypothetical protein
MNKEIFAISAALFCGSCFAQPNILPPKLADRAAVIAPNPQENKYIERIFAQMPQIVRKPGEGGLVSATWIKVEQDIRVYRMWNGPPARNRIGNWWTYERPRGTVHQYRRDYDICTQWNALRAVATCTLKAGAFAVVGPGQSVSAETCGNPGESYPPNSRHWQIYFQASGPQRNLLECPPEQDDYMADPFELNRPIAVRD